MSEDELAAQAARLAKMLGWAGFLLVAALVVLAIDLQLKRSIARTAMVAAGRHDAIVKMADGIMADLTRGGAHGSSARTDDDGSDGRDTDLGRMDAGPSVATSDHPGSRTTARLPDAAPAGQGKRPPGNGRRAGGTAE